MGILGFILESAITDHSPIYSLVFLICIICGILIFMNRYISKYIYTATEEITSGFINQEAYNSILSLITPRYPLPSLQGYAASADFLKVIIEHIYTKHPQFIVELGSGSSTIYIGYILEQLKKGNLLSVDQSQQYTNETQQNIKNHELEKNVEVTYAPLQNITLKNDTYLWYQDFSKKLSQIDMLIVDGPSGNHKDSPRYPALPLLFKYLAENATVIVDDYNREKVKKMVKKWLSDYPDLELSEINTTKETAVLTNTHKN